MKNKETDGLLSATGPRPGDFPLGSPESRAAARGQLDATVDVLIEKFSEAAQRGEVEQFMKTMSLEDCNAVLKRVERMRGGER